jgi:hypothetical protein
MERSLVWSALAIGLACWLVAFGLTRTKRFAFAGIENAVPPASLALAAGLPILLFVLTFPSHGKLFAPGHDLGSGFLIGAIGALLSGVLLLQNLLAGAGARGHLRIAAVTACPFALGVACAASLLLVRHDTLYIALLGSAIGWLASTGVLLLGLMHGSRGKDSLRPEPVTMLAGAGFVTLLCSTVALGDYHGEVTFIKASTSISWGVLALATAAAVPLFLILSAAADLLFNSEPNQRSGAKPSPARSLAAATRAQIGRGVIAIAGVAVLAKMLSNRVLETVEENASSSTIVGPPRLFQVIGIGLLTGLLVWWISNTVQNRERADEESSVLPPSLPWQNTALGTLVVVAGAMAAYQLLAGFGVGLMLIGSVPSVGLALLAANDLDETGNEGAAARRTECALRVVQLASLGAILALFRVYTTINEGMFPHSPYTDQYAAFGFVAGAVLPLFLAGYLLPARSNSDAFSAIGRLLVSGALILAIPSVILALWGQKCIMAFITALAISSAGVAMAPMANSLANLVRKLFPAIYAIGVSLALCEWSHYVMDMEDWTRIQKERVIVQIVGVAILLVIGADYGPRIARWVKRDRAVSTPGAKGGVR